MRVPYRCAHCGGVHDAIEVDTGSGKAYFAGPCTIPIKIIPTRTR